MDVACSQITIQGLMACSQGSMHMEGIKASFPGPKGDGVEHLRASDVAAWLFLGWMEREGKPSRYPEPK